MESNIIAMNAQKCFSNTACTMIPKADSHVITTIYIFEAILSRIILERHVKGKKHLPPEKQLYSSKYVELKRYKQMCEINI